jgi:hypothetical protein
MMRIQVDPRRTIVEATSETKILFLRHGGLPRYMKKQRPQCRGKNMIDKRKVRDRVLTPTLKSLRAS